MRWMSNFRRFGAEKKGVAALEFALIAPMMIFLMFASVDLLEVMNANKRVQNATASLADIVARDTEVSDDEVTGLWDALDVLMFPNDGEGMQVRITSVSILSTTNARVVWSEGHAGMTALSPNAAVELPDGMMRPGSLIMTETSYIFQSPMNFLFEGPLTMTHRAYRRSRLVDPIPRA